MTILLVSPVCLPGSSEKLAGSKLHGEFVEVVVENREERCHVIAFYVKLYIFSSNL